MPHPQFNKLQVPRVTNPNAAQVATGIPLSKVNILRAMTPDDWEEFTEEWLSSKLGPGGAYVELRRYGGAGDSGLDVVAFSDQLGFDAAWDSFQCKSYGQHALQPNEVYLELAKIIYYSFSQKPPFDKASPVPRAHVFVAPCGVGTSLSHLLKNPARLREKLRDNWSKHCQTKIGRGIDAKMEGGLLSYFNTFDFSIFKDITPATLIREHAETEFHIARFGGGLPPRPSPSMPPVNPTAVESNYIRKILDAYEDHLGTPIQSTLKLAQENPDLCSHLNRQRELFYCAESLLSYSRDASIEGTFDSFRGEILDGVYEVVRDEHNSGYRRLCSTIHAAGMLPLTANGLATVAKTRDKQGACHQLANDDLLTWVKDNG